jgi:hypothetical protein
VAEGVEGLLVFQRAYVLSLDVPALGFIELT